MYILFVCIFVSESAFSSSSRLRTESESQLGFMSAAYLRIGTSCYYARSLRSRKPLVQDWLAQFGPLVSPMTHGMKMRRKRRKKKKQTRSHMLEKMKRGADQRTRRLVTLISLFSLLVVSLTTRFIWLLLHVTCLYAHTRISAINEFIFYLIFNEHNIFKKKGLEKQILFDTFKIEDHRFLVNVFLGGILLRLANPFTVEVATLYKMIGFVILYIDMKILVQLQ